MGPEPDTNYQRLPLYLATPVTVITNCYTYVLLKANLQFGAVARHAGGSSYESYLPVISYIIAFNSGTVPGTYLPIFTIFEARVAWI